MKKFIITIFAVAFPFILQAQSEGLIARKNTKKTEQEMSIYTASGAIPEVDGKVMFKDIIAAAGKTKDEIFTKLAQWASFRYEANSVNGVYTDADFFKNIEYAQVKLADKQKGEIQCQGAEELIFSIKPLAKNFTQAFYLLNLEVKDGQVAFNLHTLSFNVDQGSGEFIRVTAENWITDKEALTKKGKLRRIPSKFRIKTIDLVTELKKEISDAINQ
ncbi:MAG: DUF4468 domain-containing protein [Bacteroidaceae bacterium]|nr:DUF4468 domain-containing protein [Bacteroidaceae bacterium]